MFQRCKHISDIGQAILRPGLEGDIQAVGSFAPGDGSLPFAVATVERQDGRARGKPQHAAEIIALVALQGHRLTSRQRGIDKQPGTSKIELRHASCSNSEPFSLKTAKFRNLSASARPYAALLPNSTGC